MKNNQSDTPEKTGAGPDDSRREFIKNVGKFALYAPPTMVALMQPSKANATILKSPGERCRNYDFSEVREQIQERREERRERVGGFLSRLFSRGD